MEAINELTSKTTIKAAYNKLSTECDVDSAPRDSEVVRNQKYNTNKQHYKQKGVGNCVNFADEWQVNSTDSNQ